MYAMGSHTLHQRRHPSAAIAWVVSLVLMPYLTLPLYLLLGTRKVTRQSQSSEMHAVAGLNDPPGRASSMADQLARAMGLPEVVNYHALTIHHDGAQACTALFALIDSATNTLDLCSFILGRDALGDAVTARLIARAQAGVRVRLMIDGVGYFMGGWPNLRRLRAAGVLVTLFVPPWRADLRGHTNLRNHRKLVVVDHTWMWCGGRNLAADYFMGAQRAHGQETPWVDLSFDVHGGLVQQGLAQFEQDWAFATTGAYSAPLRQPTLEHPVLTPNTAVNGAGQARLVPSGPDQADDTVYTFLVAGCFTARSRILAVTPYFVPDPTLQMALVLAARRGITVDLLLPRQSNHRLADLARNAALRELAAAGASIWLSTHMVHAKAIIIDDGLAMVGSANLDERSLLLNYELMVAFYEPAAVKGFADWIQGHIKEATRAQLQRPSLRRELLESLVRWVAFQL